MRIIDLTMVWAGPFAGQLLADLGAEVIKVEARQRVDMVRWGATADNRPRETGLNLGGVFHTLNRNKLGITLDLSAPDGREALLRLVERSDGLIENYSRRVMENFGLGYAALRAANPRLVMVSMPGYGDSGPYRDFVSFGEVLEGMAGIAALAGYPDGPPLRHGIAYLDPVGGYHGALAMLAALYEREHTGAGRRLVLAQRDAGIRLIGDLLLGVQMGITPSATAPPAQTASRTVSIPRVARRPGGALRAQRYRLAGVCHVLIRPDLAADPTLATLSGRRGQRDRVDAAIAAWTAERTAAEAAAALTAAGVPAAPVHSVATITGDPQISARGCSSLSSTISPDAAR
ncbi:MAG: CoA transferase [Dehalococcoidia bacterium]